MDRQVATVPEGQLRRHGFVHFNWLSPGIGEESFKLAQADAATATSNIAGIFMSSTSCQCPPHWNYVAICMLASINASPHMQFQDKQVGGNRIIE